MIPKFAEPVDANLLLGIVRHVELAGVPPTWQEMRQITGHQNQWIHKRLHALRDAGFIVWATETTKGTLRPRVTEVPLRRTRESESA